MRYLSLLCFAVLLHCSSNTEPGTGGPAPETPAFTSGLADETSAPQPGTTPQPEITGTADLTFTALPEFPNVVEGCSCELRLESMDEEDFLLVFNYPEGPAVIGLNNKQLEIPQLRHGEATINGQDQITYIHENSDYRIITTLADEGPWGAEGRSYSGRVRVKVKADGTFKQGLIVGYCSC